MSGQNKVAFGSLVTGAAFSVEADGDVLVKIAVDTGVSLLNGSAKDSRPFGFEASRLVCPRHVAVVSNHEPVSWSNGCNTSVPAALRFLANHDRPSGGESRYNGMHLMQLAEEIESMAKRQLYEVPPASVSRGKFLGLVEGCKHQEQQIAELWARLNTVRLYEEKEVWYWAGDGEDHLESLTCPVVINAEDLRELLARQVLLSDGAALAPDAVQVVNVLKCDGNHGGPRCADPECWTDVVDASWPAEWSGEGIPPAGTFCEMQDAQGAWVKVEIIANHAGFAHGWDAGYKRSYFSDLPQEFRPLRTAEQIAAEERSNRICEMASLIGAPLSPLTPTEIIEKLHDAGYRKIEGGGQ